MNGPWGGVDPGYLSLPLTVYRPDADSTSAQLRQTQQALAASQADLTRVEAERDDARGIAELYLRQRDLARAELVSARTELAFLRANGAPPQ